MARLRTFIAVGIDKAIRSRAVSLQQKLAETESQVRWVEPENMHVTLLFLGEVDARTVPAVCQVVAQTAQQHAPFEMSIEQAGCFPNPRRPRTLWVGVGAGTQKLVALHDALEPPLLDLGCYRREERQYTPHLTLGRVKGDANDADLAQALLRNANWRCGSVTVQEVLVMSSELGASGPEYTVLGRGKLGG